MKDRLMSLEMIKPVIVKQERCTQEAQSSGKKGEREGKSYPRPGDNGLLGRARTIHSRIDRAETPHYYYS